MLIQQFINFLGHRWSQSKKQLSAKAFAEQRSWRSLWEKWCIRKTSHVHLIWDPVNVSSFDWKWAFLLGTKFSSTKIPK